MSEHCWQCAVAEEQGWPKPHAPGRDCKHGHLARSCDTCDAEAERDELRTALRDLREYIYWPDRAAAHVGEEALRARIDALIGPYDPHSVTRPTSL